MFYKIQDILNKLENCIEYKIPFSHIRFGDGGIKLIHSIIYNDVTLLKAICKREGLPYDRIMDIFEMLGYFARRADMIDTPEVYYNGTFWPRIKKKNHKINLKTEKKLIDWRDLYSRAEFDNENYCNPESNCLLILKMNGRRNLFDIIKNKKVCVITAKPELKHIFPHFDIVPIVGHFENQYENSYVNVVEFIINRAKDYDVFLTAAGELGRLYSGYIKEMGGRSIDIGFVAEFWLTGYLHPRLHTFVNSSLCNEHELVLTNEGKKYEQYI